MSRIPRAGVHSDDRLSPRASLLWIALLVAASWVVILGAIL